jgi:hypothetical protein
LVFGDKLTSKGSIPAKARITIRIVISIYAKENWSAPVIVGFMALLVVAAFSLLTNFVVLADALVVFAYYALVVGFVLQCV